MSIVNKSIRELNALFLQKELKPSELYDEIFEVTSNSEAVLHAHLKLFENENREALQNADKRFEDGSSLGFLDGIPLSIKDNINLKGSNTTCSSKMLENYVSPYDATVISNLKNQGPLFTGKT